MIILGHNINIYSYIKKFTFDGRKEKSTITVGKLDRVL